MPHPELGVHEADLLHEGATLISFLWPGKNKELIERLAARKVTVLAMDQVPRITRAQKMDALSSMANIAGYRAVIEAASYYGRFFTGQMTAAGQGAAGARCWSSARRRRAWPRSAPRAASARSCARSTRGRRCASRSRAWAPSSSSSTFEEDGEGEGGYAKEMSAAFIAAEMALFARAGARTSTSSSRPR